MFAYDQSQYMAGTRAVLNIHHKNLHQDIKYICNTCGHQTSSKEGRRSHQQVVHEGQKYPCLECEYRATTKGSLTEHKAALHEGKQYPCD